MSGFSELLAGFRELLEAEMNAWLGARRQQARIELPEAGDLADTVADLVLAGGKRLRPALVYFTFRACGGSDRSAVLPAAMATELLHAYLLIHDDLMDHSALRRGQPTPHVRYAELHRSQEWSGDSAEFGRAAAILLGDLAHSWAVERFSESLLHPAAARRAGDLDRCFGEMCREVIGGQYLEMLLAVRRTASEKDLLDVLRLKSGRYSVERPMQLGALLAGAGDDVVTTLSGYGQAVGEAFQLQDDVLGLFGDPETVGKPVGSDLAEGKYTYLIHHTLEAVDDAEGERVRRALGRPDLAADEVEAVLAIIRRSGALEQVRSMIAERLDEARRVLAGMAFGGPENAFFAGLVDRMAERER
ncbi:MAG: polyprenyl synthetase family protein [Acidobacteriota bacterium]